MKKIIVKNNIEELKMRNEMTYREIAEIAKVSVAYICQLAKSKRKNPSFSVMERIAFALQSTVYMVFKMGYKSQIMA